jgi:Ca2+-transporting ATPase
MKRPPLRSGGFFFSKKQQFRIFIQGLAIVAGVLFVYTLILKQGLLLEEARSAAFATTLFSIVFLAFNSRSETQSLLKLGFISNRNMTVFGVSSLLTTILSIQLPQLQPFFRTAALTPFNWVLILVVSFISSFWIEIAKIVRARIEFQQH